jgi:hypothetical protein
MYINKSKSGLVRFNATSNHFNIHLSSLSDFLTHPHVYFNTLSLPLGNMYLNTYNYLLLE